MATLDTMVMAGKEAPSEEPVPLVSILEGFAQIDRGEFVDIGEWIASLKAQVAAEHGEGLASQP